MNYALATRNWEAIFEGWGKPPSQTEQDKCENAERAIRKAIAASDALTSRSVDVFAQGSYRNRTNVRQESDVDICVRCTDTFFYDVEPGVSLQDAGIIASTYLFTQFKNDVGTALTNYFGSQAIRRGDKAFDVHANTYRVDADVVPTFEYRYFYRPTNGRIVYHSGTKFVCDTGREIINWPQQNYDNGVRKNDVTGRRFKAVVRILKRLRNEMAEARITAAQPIASYLNECLAWNVPNEGFGHTDYKADVRYAIAHLWTNTRTVDTCREWAEINQRKYLFHTSQPWTPEQAHAFLDAAWTYVGFQ
jgi:hypothetical protein